MARKLRVEYSGACYHVINRGNYRRDLFAAKGTAESFQKCLFEAAAKFGWRLHAFVIMRNHFHLAVETPEPNLSEGMRWLQGTWAGRFNRFRAEGGRPFQGRYKALHVEPGHALAQVAHYIHLNPIRAKVVTAERILEYRWSSLPLFVAKARPTCLEPRTILVESGDLADTAAGWRRYLNYLDVVAEEEVKLREAKFGRLSRGWVIGSEEFKSDLKKELAAQGANLDRLLALGTDGTALRELREQGWEDQLKALSRKLGVKLNKLPPKKSAPEKVQLAAAMKLTSSASNAWIAEKLQMGKPATVSQFVRRFRLSGGTEQRRFRAILSKVKQ
ncbi:MAG: transposase [Opitutaceae bacterium]